MIRKPIVALQLAGLLLPAAAFLFAGLAMAHGGHEDTGGLFTKHFSKSLFDVSVKGQMSIEVLQNADEYPVGDGLAGIVVHDRNDGDVEHATVEVSIAPVSGGAIEVAVVEKGHGLYAMPASVMSGTKQRVMTVRVRTKDIHDEVSFTLPDAQQKTVPAGRYRQ